MELFSFGTIFSYQGDFYVYLCEKDGILFAAKILSREDTAGLTRLQEHQSKLPGNTVASNWSFSFVTLTATTDFERQGAHYGQPQQDSGMKMRHYGDLDATDSHMLKQAIFADTACPKALQIALRDIFPEEEGNK